MALNAFKYIFVSARDAGGGAGTFFPEIYLVDSNSLFIFVQSLSVRFACC